MASDTISLTFNGYWGWKELNLIPNESGVFVVYDGLRNMMTKELYLRRILCFGEAPNVRERVRELWSDWKAHVKRGGKIFISFAPASLETRLRAEAALTYEHQPALDSPKKKQFLFKDTIMIVDGRTEYLKPALVIRGQSVVGAHAEPRLRLYAGGGHRAEQASA